MECYEMPTMSAVRKRAEIAKRVAALLAENAATVSEIDVIFNMAKHYVTVMLPPDLQPVPEDSASALAPESDSQL